MSSSEEKIGRTWADVAVATPRYLIVVFLALILAMVVRAEFSDGVTNYGFLGDWGKEQAETSGSDEAIIGANARLNRQLKCAQLSLDALPGQIEDWKQYMEDTAETYANHSLRQSRTATWKAEVDDVLRDVSVVQQYLSGDRRNC